MSLWNVTSICPAGMNARMAVWPTRHSSPPLFTPVTTASTTWPTLSSSHPATLRAAPFLWARYKPSSAS